VTNILVLNETALQGVLSEAAVIAALREAFEGLAQGQAVQPPQLLTLLPGNKGDFITYQGVLSGAGVFGAKVSPYLVRGGNGHVSAWTVLFSLETGQPVLLCDSYQLTTERTAATTALAVDLLAPKQAASLALIGTGRVGQAHLRYVKTLRDWVSIRAYSPNALKHKVQLEALGATLTATPQEAVASADVVLLCTSSGTPVTHLEWLSEDALITSISTNVANAHEISPAALPTLNVYCDYRPNTPTVAGEMKLAAEKHGWSAASILADLPELVTRTHRRPAGRAFFRSVGLGLEDISVAAAALKRVKET
jgi:L-arginine dehydrogenase